MNYKISKLIGGLLVAGMLVFSMAGQVFGAAAVITISGITQNGSATPVAEGSFVQVIESTDGTIGAPGTTGVPAGDTVVVTGTIRPAGTFQSGASIASNRYVAIRVWQTWNGTGTPSGYYGTSPAEDVGAGFVYNYDPAGFACATEYSSGGGGDPTPEANAFSIAPTSAYVGQTIVITRTGTTGFGATMGTSTVTVGTTAARPTVWSNDSITLAVPSGVSGTANVTVTVGGSAIGPVALTVRGGGVVIDDYEGGAVGNWVVIPTSGYYVFEGSQDITPNNDNINNELRQSGAASHGNNGANVRYSFIGTDTTPWGGGWGSSLANTLNLEPYSSISFYVRWDGTANEITIGLSDVDGTSTIATVSNSSLMRTVLSHGLITLNRSAFAYDEAGSRAGSNAIFDWTQVTGYNMIYRTPGTTTSFHSIDSIYAGEVEWSGAPPIVTPTGEVVITSINPSATPAGVRFTITGTGFGNTQGSSLVHFENQTTHNSFPVEVVSWSATSIEAIVPPLAPVGNYGLRVVRIAISAGTLTAFESNIANLNVTLNTSASGIATVFPNPFNPLERAVPATRASGLSGSNTIIAYQAAGVTEVGVYIYDMTAQLVHHETTNSTQVGWNGRDDDGYVVADGLYIIRIINEETKELISKGKILVIKN